MCWLLLVPVACRCETDDASTAAAAGCKQQNAITLDARDDVCFGAD